MNKQTAKLGKKKRISKREANEWLWGYLFIAPVMVLTIIFVLIPIVSSLGMCFTDWNGVTKAQYVGLDNFRTLFRDVKILIEYKNTFIYALFTVPINILLGIIFSTVVVGRDKKGIKGINAFRAIYYLPAVTMPVAVSAVWSWLLNSKSGLINYLLGLVGIEGPKWLIDPKYIMPSIILITIWGGVGATMIYLIAAIIGIPESYYESAQIDGAGRFVQFSKITVPMITPTIFFLSITNTLGALKAFDLIYMFVGTYSSNRSDLKLASRTVVYGIYEDAFQFMRMGLASAKSILLCAVLIIITLIQFKLQNRWVYYDN